MLKNYLSAAHSDTATVLAIVANTVRPAAGTDAPFSRTFGNCIWRTWLKTVTNHLTNRFFTSETSGFGSALHPFSGYSRPVRVFLHSTVLVFVKSWMYVVCSLHDSPTGLLHSPQAPFCHLQLVPTHGNFLRGGGVPKCRSQSAFFAFWRRPRPFRRR